MRRAAEAPSPATRPITASTPRLIRRRTPGHGPARRYGDNARLSPGRGCTGSTGGYGGVCRAGAEPVGLPVVPGPGALSASSPGVVGGFGDNGQKSR